MAPLFSVIVPIYKVERYLVQCIESIVNQSYSNIEIILVNDGSPDNCPLICNIFAEQDSRVKVIHQPNGGIVSARQAGAYIATGDYIACVDGDDWLHQKYFEIFADVVEQYAPNIICCGSIWASEHTEVKHPYPIQPGLYERQEIEECIFPMLIERADGVCFPPSLWAKAFNRQLYLEHQLVDEFVNIGEDGACVKPSIYQAQSLFIMHECLYYYRQHLESITKNRNAFDWNGPKIIGQHYEKQIDMKQRDFQEQVYRSIVHNLFNVAVSQFNLKFGYSSISKQIKEHLRDPYYANAIYSCCYRGSIKGTFAQFALKHKCILLLCFYNLVKR